MTSTASSTARLRPTHPGDAGGTGRGSTFILRKGPADSRLSGGIMGAMVEAGTGAAASRGATGGGLGTGGAGRAGATGWGRDGAAVGGGGAGAGAGRGGGGAAAFSAAAAAAKPGPALINSSSTEIGTKPSS